MTASPAPAVPLIEAASLRRLFALRRSVSMLLGRRPLRLHAVDEVSFSLASGEILALVGESGCGKSTIGRLLVRLDTPTSGAVRFRGRDVAELRGRDLRDFRRRAQIVFQNPFDAFDGRLTMRASLLQALRVHAIGAPATRLERIAAGLENAGLVPARDYLDRYPHELSGGQLQRLATVRVMLLEPRFLVADEPVSMLDVSVRAEILNHLLDLRARHDMGIVFITHDIAVARYVADRIAVMYLGQFVELGPVDAVVDRPLHPYTRALLSHTLSVANDGGRVPLAIGDALPVPINLGAGCRFAGRCPFVFARCHVETPALATVEPDHVVACHLYRRPESGDVARDAAATGSAP